MDLFLNKLEFPSPKDALCQVYLKLAQWFLRRRLLNFINVYSLFHNYLPLEKDVAVDLNIFESPSPKDSLCQVWLKMAQWFLRRRWKCEKFTDGQTERQRTTGDQKSSLELIAQVREQYGHQWLWFIRVLWDKWILKFFFYPALN